jgi:hypothetical protein
VKYREINMGPSKCTIQCTLIKWKVISCTLNEPWSAFQSVSWHGRETSKEKSYSTGVSCARGVDSARRGEQATDSLHYRTKKFP